MIARWSLALSVLAAVVSGGAAYTAWRARRNVTTLARRYTNAISLVALIARADLGIDEARALCEQLLDQHGAAVTTTTTRGPAAGESIH